MLPSARSAMSNNIKEYFLLDLPIQSAGIKA